MAIESYFVLMSLLCGATVIQSLTGFGFGLFVVTSFTLMTSLPVTTTTFLISALSLVNAIEMAFRFRHHIQWSEVKATLCTGIPMIVIGFLLLEWLSMTNRAILLLVLGFTILGCSALLLVKKHISERTSPLWQFSVAGTIAGLLGGLFSTFGPPIVFQCYRQPWQLEQIRATLLLMFCFGATTRLALTPFGTIPDLSVLMFTLAAIPAVIVSTQFARKLLPYVSARVVRTAAILMLAAGGISLFAKAFMAFYTR